MIIQSYLKYLLCDQESLYQYYQKMTPVQLDDVKRSLLLIERNNNVTIPDHYYRLAQEKTFENIEFMSQLFTKGMVELANEYLEWNPKDNKVYAKANKQNEWQLILPFIPPLFMQSLILWKHTLLENDYTHYIHSVLKNSITYTALPHPNILQIKDFVKEKHGLHDLHIHLNGTLETDIIWQDFLEEPDKAYNDLSSAIKKEKVKELYSEQSPFFQPENFRNLLYIARNIRETLYQYIFNQRTASGNPLSLSQYLFNLKEMNKISEWRHPMYNIINKECPTLLAECLFYIKVLTFMEQNKENNFVSCLFHYYLLILGQVNKMLVQQTTCNGFEEFQKYTLGRFRGFSEQFYNRRFYQLAGNCLNNIRVLEGRFAPRATLGQEEKLLTSIREGWEKMTETQRKQNIQESELLLVAHFIKEADRNPDPCIRFKAKRQDLKVKANILVNLLNSKSRNSQLVKSVDAAASEFDTPPEVFSCCYRYLREHGVHHFTYHAGEDFFHLLSGLRAIFEAVDFLDLRSSDRIGHATACGVSVDVWLKNIEDEMLIRQGEHLDNLLFAYYMIDLYGDIELKALMPSIALKVENLCTDVYGTYYPISLQIQAWLIRYKDPLEILEKSLQRHDVHSVNEETIFLQYHRIETVQRYNKIIKIKTEDILDKNALTKMQLIILKLLHDKDIIIETLPTSNVIIGHHHSFKTYHLYNWYKWSKEGHSIPPIVVGSDDAGIFATNIYNEYCNIYCQLLYHQGMNSNEIMDFIRELDYNSHLYKFS